MKQISLVFLLLLLSIFTVNAQNCFPLNSPWNGVDIGEVALGGTSCYNTSENSFEVTASGADIWGASDEFHYVYQELTGDGEIVARVDELTYTHPWAKAGVMMRNSADSDAAQILMSLSPNPINMGIAYSLQHRSTKGATMYDIQNNIGPVPVGAFPYYVRLVREGNRFTGYASSTNGNWTLVGTRNIIMDNTIIIGLATTSHRDGTATTAQYSEVEIKEGNQSDLTAFITMWKTDNPGTSADNQITIPTSITIPTPYSEIYNYSIDWGDGTFDYGVTQDITHTYSIPGIYRVSINGTFPRFLFSGSGNYGRDVGKIIEVIQWGDMEWSSMQGAFRGCENLTVSAQDIPNLSKLSDMSNMFRGCISLLDVPSINDWDVSKVTNMAGLFASSGFNGDISDWDVGNVTATGFMFYNSPFNQNIGNWDLSSAESLVSMLRNTPFNQNIGSWDISNAKYMNAMFDDSALSSDNYDALLQDWASLPNLQANVSFSGGNSQYCQGERARQTLIDDFGWTITDGRKSADCIDDTSDGIFLEAECEKLGNFWNSVEDSTASGGRFIAAPEIGTSEPPTSVGYFMEFKFNANEGEYKIYSLVKTPSALSDSFWVRLNEGEWIDWNSIQGSDEFSWQPIHRGQNIADIVTFNLIQGANKLEFAGQNAEVGLDKIYLTTGNAAPMGLGGDATNCSYAGIKPFVTTWRTNNYGSSNYNQITIPTTSAFNYNYNVEWGDGTSNVGVTGDITHDYAIPGIYQVSISGNFPAIRFAHGKDNQKILSVDAWGDIEWYSMFSAFQGCINLDIKAADIPDFEDLTNFQYTFDRCRSLIGTPSMAAWRMPKVRATDLMFNGAERFNQDISTWDVSNIKQMRGMFQDAKSFNQDLNDWNVSGVTNFTRLFYRANAFNKSLKDWDIGNARVTDNIFDETSLSQENYDEILIGWSTLESGENNIPMDLNLGAGDTTFCLGEEARQKLIDDFGWTITDGGKSADCEEPQRPFITTWKTDNPGTSADNQITIPTFSGETYNYTVDWGDGTSDSGVAGDISHFYTSMGTYQIRIFGNYPRIAFGNSGDSDKLVSVDQWGDTQWTSMADAFSNCSNMQVLAIDTPNLSNVTSLHDMFRNADSMNNDISGWDTSNITLMSYMFYDADSFNQDISGWDTSNVTGMYFMFYRADLFNQDLSHWDVSSVTNMSLMFSGSDLSSSNYDSMLVSWSEQEGLKSSVPFGAHGISYCEGAGARQKLIDTYNWDISDDGLECLNSIPFITTWKTDNPGTSEDNQVIISTNDGAFTPYNYDYNYTVHWGDGSSDTGVSGDIIHTYATAGTYTVSITGDFPRIYFEPDFSGNYDSGKLLSVEQWGDIEWLSMEFAFSTCQNLDVKATDLPNLSKVQSMAGMFQGCSSLIGNPTFNDWDVSNVADMNSMFNDASNFNQDIGSWEVGNVQGFDRMFEIASSFNQDISDWDVSHAKYMYAMFFEASAFDQDLGSWNVTGVINMSGMFGDAGLSSENYDSLLMGWSALPLQSGIVFSGGNSQYCLGEEARQKLIDDFGWTINDGGLSDECAKRCVALPSPWTGTDIGAVAVAGTSCYNAAQDTFEVTASGADIWGTNDEFHYVYQELTGDGEIIARVDGLTNTHQWAKAGVMMRNNTASDAAQILMSLSPNPVNVGIGYSLQDRPSKGVYMRSDLNNIGPVPVGNFPYYVRLVREGNNFSGYASATNGNWTLVGTKTIPMNDSILVGLATTSHKDGTLTKANYSEVSIKREIDVIENNPPEIFLEGDEFVLLFSGEPYIELGATAIDIEDGDLSDFIRISSTVDTTRPGFYEVYYFVSDSDGASATEIRMVVVEEGPDFTPPVITLIGPESITLTVGETYTELGATAIDDVDGDLTQDLIVDVSSVNTSLPGSYSVTYNVTDALGNSAIEKVRTIIVIPEDICLPLPWQNSDIGGVAVAGAACYDSSQNTIEVTASGADIWGSSDEFHYVYQRLTGDGEIIARVDALTNTHPWAKAGVMMRNGIEGDAAQILMSLSTNPVNVGIGYSLQDRPTKGATMNSVANNIGPVPVGSFPYYVRLVRDGNNFSGYASATNGSWTLVGTKTISMNTTILVGLATTSHNDGVITTARYSDVNIIGTTSAAKSGVADDQFQNETNAMVSDRAIFEMRVFPNPSSEIVTISFPRILSISEFHIYDMTGRLVGTQKMNANRDNNKFQLNISSYNTGTYFLRAQDEFGRVHQKQMVIKH